MGTSRLAPLADPPSRARAIEPSPTCWASPRRDPRSGGAPSGTLAAVFVRVRTRGREPLGYALGSSFSDAELMQ
jgi:hypothetical protein